MEVIFGVHYLCCEFPSTAYFCFVSWAKRKKAMIYYLYSFMYPTNILLLFSIRVNIFLFPRVKNHYPSFSRGTIRTFSTWSRPVRRYFTKVLTQRIMLKFLSPGYPLNFKVSPSFFSLLCIWSSCTQAFSTFHVCATVHRNPCTIVSHYIELVKLYIFQQVLHTKYWTKYY